MEEKKDRLTELLSDEGFMKKLFSQETPEKAQEILKENNFPSELIVNSDVEKFLDIVRFRKNF